MKKLHGKNAAIYFNGVKVTVKTAWTIQIQHQFADVSTFRDKNVVYAVGLADISGTFEGLLDVDGDAAVTVSNGSVVTIAVYTTDGDATPIATGPGYLDAQISASVSDAVKCSGSWKAAGDWTIN